MIIGIDGNEANVENLVGVSVYTRSLLSHFQKKATSKTRFNVFLRHRPSDSMPTETEFYKYQVVAPSFLFSQITLPLALMSKNDTDVFFSPAHYAPRVSPAPTVVTIHDLSYFYYPKEFLRKDLFQLKRWTAYSVKNARKVICVSEATKKDLMKYYKTPEDKITVIYNGYEKPVITGKQKDHGLKLKKGKYILYVGTLQPRKNIQTLIRAFETFQKENKDFKLILVGKKGWLYKEIFELVQTLNLQDHVIFAGYVSDHELHQLYQDAFCFVLPSFYEGFGIPLLEAMNEGVPVIAAGSSALPEVGGDACLYFDPYNAGKLLLQLNRLKKDQKLATSMVAKGKTRIKLFSWKKCAEETLKVIKSAV